MIKRYLETRRQYPRLKTDIHAIVSSQSKKEFPAVIRDLSPDGAQIIYQGNRDELLYEKNASYDVLKKLVIKLKFTLPHIKNNQVEINSKPIHHHHLGNYKYIVGVVFDNNDTEQNNKIMDYLIYEAGPSLDEIKEIYANKKIILPHKKHLTNITKDVENKESFTDNNIAKEGINFDIKHELHMMSTTLNSLVSSIRLIEDKLGRIERKISKK
jgi:PilZ domain-containing protein